MPLSEPTVAKEKKHVIICKKIEDLKISIKQLSDLIWEIKDNIPQGNETKEKEVPYPTLTNFLNQTPEILDQLNEELKKMRDDLAVSVF